MVYFYAWFQMVAAPPPRLAADHLAFLRCCCCMVFLQFFLFYCILTNEVRILPAKPPRLTEDSWNLVSLGRAGGFLLFWQVGQWGWRSGGGASSLYHPCGSRGAQGQPTEPLPVLWPVNLTQAIWGSKPCLWPEDVAWARGKRRKQPQLTGC